MFNSKFFTAVIGLTFLALGATVALQVLEMKEYNLLAHFVVQKRLFSKFL